ncbi:Serine/threonine-protein kinase Nek1 [Armadillidium nasatum]|uniref:non-specific serine/threonine protein kinase n=1 Tax=Armadillidium nasatum TaxID=96803 RepID=A0A5N5SVP7_9CRUS|nr:Serine/threonine-protein kinase Nek1 [Armadillidium nasatum]
MPKMVMQQQFADSTGDKYKKILKIGCGTFGEAWLVNSVCSGRSYVMKEVKVTDLSEDELEKTQREASVLARCKHINIIRYKESFLIGSPLTMCLVMEYADGDLKTQNIFLTHKNIVKVGDFGIARFLRTKQELATTAIGTPYYLSPEICLRKPYNYRSDMWSVGCILYELCALRHPFEANDFESLVLKILQGSYPPVSCTYSKLMHDLITVLLRTNPEQRPSAEEILIIPGLRTIVQGYLKKHEEIMANFASSKLTPTSFDSPGLQKHSQDYSPSEVMSPTGTKSKLSPFNQEIIAKKSSPQNKFKFEMNHLQEAQSSPKCEKKDRETQTPPDWILKPKKECFENFDNKYINGYHISNYQDQRETKVAIVSPVKELPPKEEQSPKDIKRVDGKPPVLGKTFTVNSVEKMIQTI